MREYQHLIVACADGVAVVTLDRPRSLNALNSAMLGELDAAITTLGRDRAVRVVVVTGSGDKAFVAGADLAEMQAMSCAAARAFALFGQAVFARLEKVPQPVIAAVNGFALGGGCELALACDIRIAAENARFGLPEVGLGITPGFGGTQRLPRLIGRGRAAELMFTADTIDAAEASRIGLVDRLVPAGQALETAKVMANRIASRSPVAVGYCKSLLAAGENVGLDAGVDREADVFALCFGEADRREGMRAFAEKRAPAFAGRQEPECCQQPD